MARIIGGSVGSLRLKAAANSTRPTSDRVKESVFAILESINGISGSNVLDLYAGTGALGLEAASRGAASVTFVERNHDAFKICDANLQSVHAALVHCGQSVEMKIYLMSAARYLEKGGEVDLVFVDPPYDMRNESLMKEIKKLNLRKGGLIVVERDANSQPLVIHEKLATLRDLKYGGTRILLLQSVI